MLRRLMIWVLVGLMLTSTAAAQDSTPTPPASTPESTPTATAHPSILTAEADFLFPIGASFLFQLDAPASDIESAVLSISQEGGWPSQTIPAQLQAAENDDQKTIVSLIWEIDSAAQPRLFQALAFTWLFTYKDGTVITYGQTVEFSDSRFGWSVDDSPEAQIKLVAQTGAVRAPALRRTLNPLVERLRAETGQPLTGLSIILYDTDDTLELCNDDNKIVGEFTGAELPCQAGVLQRLYAAQGYIILRASPVNVNTALSTLTAYLVDLAYTPVWAGQAVPEWFKFGLTRFYDPATKTAELGFVINAARNSSLLVTLDNPPTDSAGRALWEAQATGWVLFMAEQVGFDGVLDIAKSINAQNSLASVYQQRTGNPIGAVGIGWQTWLFSERANAVYSLSLYAPATPTPSLTPTATLTPTITNTPTPIPTRTSTPTPSHTPVYTPSNTRTPTVTPTPTPTTTLLPRVSFTPSRVRPSGDSQTVETVGDVTSVIVLILGAIAAIGYIQRRLNS